MDDFAVDLPQVKIGHPGVVAHAWIHAWHELKDLNQIVLKKAHHAPAILQPDYILTSKLLSRIMIDRFKFIFAHLESALVKKDGTLVRKQGQNGVLIVAAKPHNLLFFRLITATS